MFSAPSPPRIALLDCYTGSNLGDAAILDATIANLRARIPEVQLSGISLSNYNMESRHGIRGIALCCTARPFYAMSNWRGETTGTASGPASDRRSLREWIKSRMPGAWSLLKRLWLTIGTLPREVRHSLRAWREMRNHDLLVICGGGQIDDEWGGPWGHPYSVLKWCVAARLAGTPAVVASVGVSRLRHSLSKRFFARALRLATYRSFRDRQSRELAEQLHSAFAGDLIVPDLAFGMPEACVPAPVSLRSRAAGRRIVAISPIAFARPGSWPTPNEAVWQNYLAAMREVITGLLDRNDFLLFVWSSMPDDRLALTEILDHLPAAERARLKERSELAAIGHGRWTDLVAALQGADLLIASRLHSVILSLLVRRLPIAISFDPKVDRLMEDFAVPDCLLDIRHFTAAQVLERVDRLERERTACARRMDEFVEGAQARLASQFDLLAALARGEGRERASQSLPPGQAAREPEARGVKMVDP